MRGLVPLPCLHPRGRCPACREVEPARSSAGPPASVCASLAPGHFVSLGLLASDMQRLALASAGPPAHPQLRARQAHCTPPPTARADEHHRSPDAHPCPGCEEVPIAAAGLGPSRPIDRAFHAAVVLPE